MELISANKKNPEHRQDNRAARSLALVPENSSNAIQVPPASEAWIEEIKSAWVDLWESDLAGVLDANSVHIAKRLFDLRNEREYLLMLYRAEPFISGSTGQTKLNPAFTAAQNLEASIVALEDRLGLSPKAKANLGLVIGQAQLTVEELNRRAKESAIELANTDNEGFKPYQ